MHSLSIAFKNVSSIFLTSLVLGQLAFAQPEVRQVDQLVFDGVPAASQAIKDRLHQYSEARNAQLAGWNSQGKGLYILTRFANSTQLHSVNTPGAARYQLTFDSEPIAGVQIQPGLKNSGVLLSQDVGGGEFFQLYYLDLASGTRKLLSDGKSRYESAKWSPTGSKIAASSTERNGKDADVMVIDLKGNRTVVTQEQGSWFPLGWSKDEKSILVLNYLSITNSKLYLLNLDSHKLIALDSAPGEVAQAAGVIASSGKVYYTSDRNSEFLRLHSFDPKTGEDQVLTPAINWNVTELALSHSGDLLAFVLNENGRSSLYSLQLDGLNPQPERLTIPDGILSELHFSPNDSLLGFTLDTGSAPADVYSLELNDLGSGMTAKLNGKTRAKVELARGVAPFSKAKLSRWTKSEVGGLNPASFAPSKLIDFPSFDGKTITAYATYPQASAKPSPVVIYIHGGPESQYQPYFAPIFQFLVNELGIAVIAPNVRGSDGYGKTFVSLDNGFKREDSVKDIGALLDWIATQPQLDKSRVAVWGGSYGGYMVLASLTHFSNRLRAGCDVVGISNFVTFLENTQEYRRDLRRVEYGDERDPKMRAFQEEISPLNNVDKIKVPLFVVQGKNDPRVPESEAQQIVTAVRSKGIDCWYLLAKDEGHGFKKKTNRDAYLQSLILFFETYLTN